MQSPNRAQPWASSQRPRSAAMTGPRFEQTDITTQPAPYAAIELIHAEPVRFVESRVAVCDGGGGPHGHPRVYINVDKPEIVPCGYCGLPFAHSHHKHYLETLPSTEYPLA
ncbi:NADH:ubiquinone oxidoreductase 18.4kD subunit [Peziza echinospora]|nr:NADH:ubiquinone oxidoreductase 18.4kD subunit [Peziza echinospora]